MEMVSRDNLTAVSFTSWQTADSRDMRIEIGTDNVYDDDDF